jgi:hypothetical protein
MIGALFDIVSAPKVESDETQSRRQTTRPKRATRSNFYPAFTERRIGFALLNGTKAFVVRCLVWFYAAPNGERRKSEIGSSQVTARDVAGMLFDIVNSASRAASDVA